MEMVEKFLKNLMEWIDQIFNWIDEIMDRTEPFTFYFIIAILFLALSEVLKIGVGGRKT